MMDGRPAPLEQARELLRRALRLLQEPPPTAELEAVVERVARASSLLWEAEREGRGDQAARASAEALSEALGRVQHLPRSGDVDHATELVARTLALLYPLVRSAQRSRREVIAPGEGPDSARSSSLPPPPTAPRPRRVSPGPAGARRRQEGRALVEVDVGLASDSHFYTGLSLDLSRGGLFVATWKPLPPGARVLLCFCLDGELLEVRGVVRWTREASDDVPPGMGVSFEEVPPATLAAIERFCAARAPLYHESS